MHTLGQSVVRLGGKDIERQAGDEAEPGISDFNIPTIGQMNPQWNERIAIQFLGKRFGIHNRIITSDVMRDNLRQSLVRQSPECRWRLQRSSPWPVVKAS